MLRTLNSWKNDRKNQNLQKNWRIQKFVQFSANKIFANENFDFKPECFENFGQAYHSVGFIENFGA